MLKMKPCFSLRLKKIVRFSGVLLPSPPPNFFFMQAEDNKSLNRRQQKKKGEEKNSQVKKVRPCMYCYQSESLTSNLMVTFWSCPQMVFPVELALCPLAFVLQLEDPRNKLSIEPFACFFQI